MNSDLALLRLTPGGVLDSTFGGTGFIVAPDQGAGEWASEIQVQADGKILIAGQSVKSTSSDTLVARFRDDGSLDPTYGTGGVVIRSFNSIIDRRVLHSRNTPAGRQARDRRHRPRPHSAAMTSSSPASRATPPRSSPRRPPRRPSSRPSPPAQARPVLAQALALWRARGADTCRLGHIDLVIADLGGNRLGEASGSTITLDDNAAGWGWDVGRTAGRGRKALSGRMDLLSALTHEVGHLLGHDHAEGGVMAETLAPGVRQADADSGLVAPESSPAFPPGVLGPRPEGAGRRSRLIRPHRTRRGRHRDAPRELRRGASIGANDAPLSTAGGRQVRSTLKDVQVIAYDEMFAQLKLCSVSSELMLPIEYFSACQQCFRWPHTPALRGRLPHRDFFADCPPVFLDFLGYRQVVMVAKLLGVLDLNSRAVARSEAVTAGHLAAVLRVERAC